MDLKARTADSIARIPGDVLARATASLLLGESKSSYRIEGESPAQDRLQEWGRLTGEAGRRPLNLDWLLELQKAVLGSTQFESLGLRQEGGFVGDRSRDGFTPIPRHFCARHQDLPDLIGGLLDFDRDFTPRVGPVLAASNLAFGFIYIHPFEDGNGRIHRYLLHHSLRRSGFCPANATLPLSATILEDLGSYRSVLESHSKRLLPVIRWRPTELGNVEVLNETADFYRYFDGTPHAEFLGDCIQRTLSESLPGEAAFLRKFDSAREAIRIRLNTSDKLAERLILLVRQNDGKLPKRRREREFAKLADAEVADLESIILRCFDD